MTMNKSFQTVPKEGVKPATYSKLKTSEAKQIAAANASARSFIAGLSKSDRWARAWRLILIGVLGVGLAVGGILLAWRAVESENLAAGIAAAAVIAVFAIALFLNPLQTIERDIVYRRWSDTIIASYYAQFAHDQATLSDLRLAGRRASDQFALLAVTHEKVAAGSAAAITAIAQAAAAAEPAADEDAAGEDVTTITLTTPEDQTSTVGVLIDAFKVAGVGPDDLEFASDGHPAGVEFKVTTGEYSGKPSAVGTATEVTVTATSAGLSKSATVTFTWTVEAS